MRNKIIYLLLPLILLGCSKKASETPSKPQLVQGSQNVSMGVMHFTPTVVEAAETKEINAITNQAKALFEEKRYDELDMFADKLRDSKEQCANGSWKFYFVYIGLYLPEEASDAEWTFHLTALQQWVYAKPDSITARVALADGLVSYAWKARGGDWASKVTEDGWRLFNQRLNKAVTVLNDAKSLKKQCPYWWSVMLGTELGLSSERSQCEATFDAAIHTWPNYSPYYCRRAYYLLPRWYGIEGEWESDLEKSADKIGGEEGDLLYARTVWSMHASRLFNNIFTECKLSWPRVDKGFSVMEKQFPDSLAAKSEHAYLAAIASDEQVVRKYFDRLEGKIDLSVWRSQENFHRFAAWAYTYGK